jgi:hypothetical protein
MQVLEKRYPDSLFTATSVHISPSEVRDHIFQIEPYDARSTAKRLVIWFEGPGESDRTGKQPHLRYPPCKQIEDSIASRYGAAKETGEWYEEAAQNRASTWLLGTERVELFCIRQDGTTPYFAASLSVYPIAPEH